MSSRSPIFFERYEGLRKLGFGSTGVVWLVQDRHTGAEYALKLIDLNIQRFPLEAVLRFRGESEALRNLSHPGILGWRGFLESEQTFGILTDFSNGISLQKFIKKTRKVPLGTAIRILGDLSSALQYMHSRSLLHGDFKSANILYYPDADKNESCVQILDFGLSHLIEHTQEWPAGTLAYMAPEMTGILKKTIDHRSDLYSLGIIAYEILTGRLPFADKDPAVLTHRHLAEIPKAPSLYRKDLPLVLEKMLLKLLAKEPMERYRSAEGFGRDMNRLKRFLEKETQDEIRFRIATEDHWSSLPSENPFVGREGLLSGIENFISKNKGSIFTIEGARGIGKSSLIREAYNSCLKHQERLVFLYRPKFAEKPVALFGFRGLLKTLVGELLTCTEDCQAEALSTLKKELGSFYPSFLELIPELRYMAKRHRLDAKREGKEDLVELMLRLISAKRKKDKRKLVIFIDDYQNLDLRSAELILESASGVSARKAAFVFSYNRELLSARQRRLANEKSVRKKATERTLGPLSKEEFMKLLSEMFSQSLEELSVLLQPLLEASGGNPRRLREILQNLVDKEVLYYKDRSWHSRMDLALQEIQASHDPGQQKQFERFTKEEMQVFIYASVFQRAFLLSSIRALFEVEAMQSQKKKETDSKENKSFDALILRTLDKGRKLGLLSLQEKGLYAFRDHSLRAALHKNLSALEKNRLHRQIAFFLKRELLPSDPTTIYDIAWHYDMAGEHRKAALAYIKSAELTENNAYSNPEAQIYYNLAADKLRQGLLPKLSSERAFFLLLKAVLHNSTISPGSLQMEEDLERLEKLTENKAHRLIPLYSLQASWNFLRGDRKKMQKIAEECLALSKKVPESKAGTAIYILNTLTLLGIVPTEKSYVERVETLKRVIKLSLESGYFADLNRTLTVLVILLCYLGKFQEAENWILKIKQEIRKQKKEDPSFFTMAAEAMLLIEKGNFSDFLKLQRAIEQMRSKLNPLAQNFVRSHEARVAVMQGNFRHASLLLEELEEEAKAENAGGTVPLILHARLLLANRQENPEVALEVYEQAKAFLKKRPDPYKQVEYDIEASQAFIAQGRFLDARKLLASSQKIANRLQSVLLDAHLNFAELRLEWQEKGQRRFHKRALGLVEKFRKMGADGHAVNYEKELAAWTEESATPSSILATLDNAKELYQLIEINQKISAMLDKKRLLREVLIGSMRITGAQHGYVFLLTQGSLGFRPELAMNSKGQKLKRNEYSFSRSILDLCQKKAESILARDAAKEAKWNVHKSIIQKKLRSILAVPIMQQGELVGILYLDNNNARSVFSAKDREIVEHFGLQAGIALFNAFLFEREQEARKKNEATLAMFEKFIPRNFTERFAEGELEALESGLSHEEELSILFSDIRSFTSLAENMEASDLFVLLNDYLRFMELPIRQFRGFVDKYIGDAIMAVFDQEPFDAIEAAIGMQRALRKLNHRRKLKGLQTIKSGIGINTGKAMIGVIGSQERIDTTVMGDTVNVASRLESLTKIYDADILIGEPVFDLVRHRENLQVRFIDRVQIKGKQENMNIFEVFSHEKASLKEKKNKYQRAFEECYQVYGSGNWSLAAKQFRDYLADFPEDKAAQALLERCLRFEKSPPIEWQGVFVQDVK